MTLPDHIVKVLDPKQTAVLVIDMQRAYCDRNAVLARNLGFNTTPIEEMIPILDGFISEARKYVQIVWKREIEDQALVQENARVKMQAEGTPAISTPGKPSFEYYGIKPESGDKEIIKELYDAFENPDLQKYLEGHGVRTLVFTGVYRSRCVDTTLRTAFRENYHIVLPEDLVAAPKDPDGDFEVERKATISIVKSLFGYVVTSQDILSAWASYQK